ncbi:DEAD/DEAH box helicase [Bartonella sp. HY329]|uniref:DEAD/DEAH box helicase n=1 Tax=unclassified Bartonella TaxID=2645622 RepID=UPI0021C703AC|nr:MULTISPECIES: DEAD/DEAH box helicase [unclassified Bartonella]UXM94282.1 DEAD/DEAH box helicase [Bartonella sp. HY329]UXN08605.1 DEAD/DEAH box helicase [Bartonella sp. HY328]
MTNSNSSGFADFGLPELLLKNLDRAGMVSPKPIQEEALPVMLDGKDLLGIAQTGSGKTLAFSLPIIAQIIKKGDKRRPKSARALILAPTRELAQQILDAISAMTKDMHLALGLVLGGVSRLKQIKRVGPGVDILIATPGRLMDLVRDKEIDLSQTQYLVLDEADRMLDMGFINDVRKIASLLRKDRQTALFSATMPKEISALAASLLNDPVRVETAPQGTTAADINQIVYGVHRRNKKDGLLGLLADDALRSVIVFSRTKHGADAIKRDLDRAGVLSGVIHGNKTQNARQKALNGFRNGTLRVLVATDIVARGIDVPGISHVINYDLPDEAESYVHRIGRTGRNGASGEAITLFDAETETVRLRGVQRVTRKKFAVEPLSDEVMKRKPVPVELPPEEDERSSRGRNGKGKPNTSRFAKGRAERKRGGEDVNGRGGRSGGRNDKPFHGRNRSEASSDGERQERSSYGERKAFDGKKSKGGNGNGRGPNANGSAKKKSGFQGGRGSRRPNRESYAA